ncbi:MAG: hypothetical protein FWD71_05065 [Oscillospiraceae bacterium]|nr:hypothetical protein [Oscillospiraceae bacterium]
MKRFSILYNDNNLNDSEYQDNQKFNDDGYNFQNVLDDLNLREISKFTSLTQKDINYVLNIMIDFKSTKDDIKVRYGVMRDFLRIPGFFEIFERQMNYFEAIREKLFAAKRNMMRTTGDVSGETSFLNYNKITQACFFLSLTYKTIFNLYREFKRLDLKSPHLIKFNDFLVDLIENTQLRQLNEECAIFGDHVNEGVVFDIDMKLNSILRIISLRLYDFRYVKPVQTGLFYSVMRRLSIEEKKDKNKEIYIEKTFTQESRISSIDDAYLKSSLEYQINLCARRLSSIYDTLIDLFLNISGELVFYKYALNMIAYMRQTGIPYCFAKLSGESDDSDNSENQENSQNSKDFMEFKDLCDITLSTSLKNAESSVVRNDCNLKENDGINIIIGANQSGKTTFLRSFGSALMFARAGLPVPAVSAKISLFKNLYTHFQRYDDELKNEGQLDTELTEMEKIVYSADGESIILMNESFSSTGIKDATQIACDVLGAFAYVGAKVIYVTHIPDVRDKLAVSGNLDGAKDINVNLYKTGQNSDGSPTFKLEKMP